MGSRCEGQRRSRFLAPSPGTPGEGWGEGSRKDVPLAETPTLTLPRSTGRADKCITLTLFATILLLSSVAQAETTAPTTRPDQPSTTATSSVDSQLIRRGRAEAPTTQASAETENNNGFELPRVAGALAIVIGLIFVLRWGGQRIFNPGSARGTTRAVQVLARSPVAPRQQIMLLQVGKRVIVVGDSAGQMTSLCEITDSDEVAALVGQIRDEKIDSSARAFGSIFRRANRDMDAESEIEPHDHQHEYENVPSEDSDDAAIASTREEITGLMEKIRLVSRQIKSS